MRKSALGSLIPAVILLSTSAGLAQGTSAERAACTPDVFRLCSSEIPSVDRITACLRREKPRLSPACQTVFNTLDRPRTATRSVNPTRGDQGGWCAFGPNPAPGQDVWIAWCAESGKTN